MPMGNVHGKTNCRCCINCEPMTDGLTISYRCYGEYSVPIKKNFAEGKAQPPRIAPLWCPQRKRNINSYKRRLAKELAEKE
jgi:hypothetical protein